MIFYDLSQPIRPDMPTYPGDAPTHIHKTHCLAQDGYESHTLSLCLHSGTHLDVPRHLVPDCRSVSDFPLSRFSGPLCVLDCLDAESRIELTPRQLSSIRPGDFVLLCTGQDARYGSRLYFSEHPSLTESSCAALVQKRIGLLGFDMPSPDHPPFAVHRTLLRSGILLLENLRNLSPLLGRDGLFLSCFPLALDCEASPVRAVAFSE